VDKSRDHLLQDGAVYRLLPVAILTMGMQSGMHSTGNYKLEFRSSNYWWARYECCLDRLPLSIIQLYLMMWFLISGFLYKMSKLYIIAYHDISFETEKYGSLSFLKDVGSDSYLWKDIYL